MKNKYVVSYRDNAGEFLAYPTSSGFFSSRERAREYMKRGIEPVAVKLGRKKEAIYKLVKIR